MVVPTRPHPPHHHTQVLPREVLAAIAQLVALEVLHQVILLHNKFHLQPIVPPQQVTQQCNAITPKAITMPILKMARSMEIQKDLTVSWLKLFSPIAYWNYLFLVQYLLIDVGSGIQCLLEIVKHMDDEGKFCEILLY